MGMSKNAPSMPPSVLAKLETALRPLLVAAVVLATAYVLFLRDTSHPLLITVLAVLLTAAAWFMPAGRRSGNRWVYGAYLVLLWLFWCNVATLASLYLSGRVPSLVQGYVAVVGSLLVGIAVGTLSVVVSRRRHGR